MLASLLWIACGALAALIATFRVQLGLLPWDPFSGWLAVAGGLVVGGLALALVFSTGVWKGSWLGTCGLALLLSLAVLGLGYYGISRFPARALVDGQVRAEWPQLHPALRLVLWLAHLSGEEVVVAAIAAPTEGTCAPLHAIGPDGYVQAVDLRFGAAGPVRAWLRQGLFVLSGFVVAPVSDHLHVALP